jgi:hypothetical protein
MANGVFHTGYRTVIELSHADLGNPDRPGLLDEITQPIDKRDRELLECLEHHTEGVCQAEEDGEHTPWMAIQRRPVNGRIVLVAAHLPIRRTPTAEESDKHKAMKERIARAAVRHGLAAEIEARSSDGKVRSDVLVTGPGGRRIGWEAQYAPISASTVRRRSQAAVGQGIVPLWVTNSDRAALIDRAPWARVDDFTWKEIASPLAMLVRAGVRHLQCWKCLPSSERPCPDTGSSCGRFHAQWMLPVLCLPPKPPTDVDHLVVASADGEYLPMRIPNQRDPHSFSRMWVPAADRERWLEIYGPSDDKEPTQPEAEDGLTFTEQDLDPTCRYGDETFVFNDPRPRRGDAGGTGLHTFDEVPPRLLVIPQIQQRLDLTEQQRCAAAALQHCRPWEVGPCAGCGTPINRYGASGRHACGSCRARVTAGRR